MRAFEKYDQRIMQMACDEQVNRTVMMCPERVGINADKQETSCMQTFRPMHNYRKLERSTGVSIRPQGIPPRFISVTVPAEKVSVSDKSSNS